VLRFASVPSSYIPYVLLALAAGAGVGFQAIVNARLAVAIGSPLGAALISFLVGTSVLAALVIARHEPLLPAGSVPWWAWIGGALGAFYIVVAAAAVPKIGPTFLLLAAILGQVTVGFVVERSGAMGVQRTSVSAVQIVGYVLVLAGIVLVRWR
jgi:bacterial/archaeal transporter family-2 protein